MLGFAALAEVALAEVPGPYNYTPPPPPFYVFTGPTQNVLPLSFAGDLVVRTSLIRPASSVTLGQNVVFIISAGRFFEIPATSVTLIFTKPDGSMLRIAGGIGQEQFFAIAGTFMPRTYVLGGMNGVDLNQRGRWTVYTQVDMAAGKEIMFTVV